MLHTKSLLLNKSNRVVPDYIQVCWEMFNFKRQKTRVDGSPPPPNVKSHKDQYSDYYKQWAIICPQ